MSEQENLISSFTTTDWLITKFAEGLSHEDSLAQAPFRVNTFNWVLGHILVSRDRVLAALNQPPSLLPAEKAVYATGSAAPDPETAVRLDRLLAALADSQARIIAGLEGVSDEELAVVFDEERQQTVADRLSGLHWHETYHTGQLEILRQVSREHPAFP